MRALTRLFTSREAMISAMGRKMPADCESVLDEAGVIGAPVRDALDVLVERYTALGQLWGVVYVEEDVPGVPELSQAADAVVERITAFVARGQREGLFRADIPATWRAWWAFPSPGRHGSTS
ncbi:hypothetical protein [Streptomyces melanosporofaciens]|nr:hypothetical protein [Streptomyces melanosporofaciens]